MTDEEGRLHRFESREATVGHLLVQEAMVLANTQVGHYLAEQNLPGLFRVHARAGSAPAASVLASTLQGWLEDGGMRHDSPAPQRLDALLGRACYRATVERHYALNLPVYVHATSPLRRYADLVNLRQIVAHSRGEPLPYGQDKLVVLADALNATLEARKEAREQGFKDRLYATVGQAIQGAEDDSANAAVLDLADHELSAAVKLGAGAGTLTPAVVQTLLARLAQDTLADDVLQRLLFRIAPDVMPLVLGAALSDWLWAQPSRAARLLNAGEQLGVVVATTTAMPAVQGFTAQVQWRWADGREEGTAGIGAQKRLAIQDAICLGLTRRLPGGATERPALAAAPTAREAAGGNAAAAAPAGQEPRGKSALLIWAQRRQLPAPAFKVSASGPSHNPRFAARVTLGSRAGVTTDALTRKDAEHAAANDLLRQLEADVALLASGQKLQDASLATGHPNPVGGLQERAQKEHWAFPRYAFETLPGPRFRCVVTLDAGQGVQMFDAEAASKQAAKTAAALAALQALAPDDEPGADDDAAPVRPTSRMAT